MIILLKLFLLMFILGIIILIHEVGHFMWAKKFGVHIYEFSIGMGKVIYSHKGKDGIDYNIRILPIGGFVSMAGEVYADDDKIPKKKLLCNKPWYQRLIIMIGGVLNNFILAIVLLILHCAIWGGGAITPKLQMITEDSAAQKAGLEAGDTIVSINGYKVSSWDKAQIILYYKNVDNNYTFGIKKSDSSYQEIVVTPDVVTDDEGNETRVFGIQIANEDTSNILKVIAYGFKKFASIISSMFYTITGLISGKISVSSLSGPVGVYQIVGEGLGNGIEYAFNYLIYILAFLSVNVGFVNILPFPAFDGGHVFFLIVEKLKGSPVNSKFESVCHTIGFILIFILMIIVTIGDIIKLF